MPTTLSDPPLKVPSPADIATEMDFSGTPFTNAPLAATAMSSSPSPSKSAATDSGVAIVLRTVSLSMRRNVPSRFDQAEDKDGFDDADGCIDADNDNDGINDAADKCPDQAEDKDGFDDADGCVDADNDNDEINDAADKCPDQAEDKDGFDDADGCVDADNDNDGILDGADKCSNEAEDKDGNADTDGCPEATTLSLGSSASFATASAKLRAPAKAALKELADKIKAAGKPLRVRIEGHTEVDPVW